VLAPWLRQQLAASPAAQELHAHEVAQALWALKGTMDQSDGVEVQRADIGWIKGCVLACVTVFGLTDMATVCGTAAADFDAMIPL
jgi:hypothetical protein